MTGGEPVRITSLAAGGDGVGRLGDGRAVFVPRTAPGDLVALGPLRLHRSWARADSAAVLEPGPDRVAPRCGHYDADRCGGCQWQHVAPEAQRRARGAVVGEALRRIGGLDVADPAVEPAPADWGYRHKLTLHVDAGGRIGLHPLGRPAESFDLRRCEIAHADLNALWRSMAARRDLLPRGLERLVLRRSRGGRLEVSVEMGGPRRAWRGADRLRRGLSDDGVEAGIRAEPGPAAFEQVYPEMGDRIRAHAVAALGDLSGRHAWDLYAGIGETADLLSAAGASVDSVEADPAARRPAGGPARRHVERVEDVVTRLQRPDVVVTNPPRTGMDRRAVEGIAAAAPARLAYVSCDPATLARDLRRLPGYRLASLRAFDLFPQTSHVESVAVLERR